MVEITGIGTDKCGFSNKDDVDGVYCTFKNGTFSGFLSWASLKKLLAFQAAQQPKEAVETA
jgi:hypothetical protein